MSGTIINLSNRLPVTVGETISHSSGGLVTALEAVTGEGRELKWIGWPGGDIDDPERQKEVERLLVKEHGCIPVFISKQEMEGYYEGFSNSSLWPMLHYMPNYLRFEVGWWEQYRAVNQRFAEKVLAVAKEDDLVWVHDYHLMLVPGMLREAMPKLKIGFFLHTPFPGYDVFRCHPRCRDLIMGLLGADQIGFHTFGYERQFRSSVLRLLGIDSEINRIHMEGHTTYLGVYPIGIPAERFQAELKSERFAERLSATAEMYKGKRVVLSVERLDYTKGILRRLQSIDLFLKHTPDRDRINFIFVSVPSREEVREYQVLRADVEAQIGRLNGEYSTLTNIPIRFIHGSVDFTDLCALYSIADVMLVTPLIDGMNLVAKEYVACQRDNPGVLVLSEFAGAAQELFNAVTVNPYDWPAVADGLRDALAMSPEDRAARMRPMRARVMSFDAKEWARSFIGDLASRPAAPDENVSIKQAAVRIGQELAQGRRVAFFLDYDGTLRELERDPLAAAPTPPVRHMLDRLRDVENLVVTLISGRKPEDMDRWFAGYPFSLVAEHGAALRPRGAAEWERLDRGIDFGWKEPILNVLRHFERSTPGTAVEEKSSSLVWHFRRADPEFGVWKARQLVDELAAMTSNMPVNVRHGRKIVEISSVHVSKGAAVMRMIGDAGYDLVVCAGDDQTDESMFALATANLLSVKVGDEPTQAQFRVSAPRTLRRFLHQALDQGRREPVVASKT